MWGSCSISTIPFLTRFCPFAFTVVALYVLHMFVSYCKSTSMQARLSERLNVQELLYELLPSHLFVPLFSLLNLNVVVKRLLNKLIYVLTPESRVLLQKLTSSQPVKKFPAFYRTRRTSARHLSLSWSRFIEYTNKTKCFCEERGVTLKFWLSLE